MGTVAAIGGEWDPSRPYWHPAATTTTVMSTFAWQPSVDFDDWETAVQFAIKVATAVGQVKVRKDGPTWVVSWTVSQSTPTIPQPYVQPWQQPYQPYWHVLGPSS